MNRFGTVAIAATLLALTGGCVHEAYKNSILARAKSVRSAPEYMIGEGDTLTITVLGQQEYTATAAVRSDGKISFPEHGDIQCAGFTPEGLRNKLEADFKTTLRLTAPRVYVAVSAFDSKNVTVLGAVTRPGRFPYRGQMRVVDLYGLAIGPTTRSKRNRALLFREVDGATKIYQVHLADLFEKGDFSTNFYIQPGDILFVPRNTYAILGDNIRTVLDPIAALFDTVGFGNSAVTNFVGAP